MNYLGNLFLTSLALTGVYFYLKGNARRAARRRHIHEPQTFKTEDLEAAIEDIKKALAKLEEKEKEK
jgi:hypothetical protein